MKINPITLHSFESLSTGQKVHNWELVNDKGMRVLLSNYGPTLVQLVIPDKLGVLTNVVLGYDNIQSYEQDNSMGRIAIGQYADLISNASYKNPEGTIIQLHPNNGKHMLHGGVHGWAMQIWNVENTEITNDKAVIEFQLTDPDMGIEGKGLPGNIDATVTVTLTNNNELCFYYQAITDITTPIKMTNHSYFNLNGTSKQTTIDNHILQTNANRYVVIDPNGIPTGEIKVVENTPFDFSKAKALGKNFQNTSFDHCLIFPENQQGTISLISPLTGITMRVITDQPAVQFYNSSNLNEPFIQYGALCIEPQQPIDYINHPEWHDQFGKPFIEKGMQYTNKISYSFSFEN